jgi:hypothetical protein
VTGPFARAGVRLVLPTAVLGFVVAFKPGHAALALRIYALVLAAYALAMAIAALRRELPPATRLHAHVPRRTRQQPPETLERLEQEAILAVSGAFELHYHLSPRLRSIARDRLARRRGISLENDEVASRAILGDEAWDLVRPDRPPPEDRLARGLPPADLSRVVTALEQI